MSYDELKMEELTAGIRQDGLLQPVVVRPSPTAPGRFQLLAGHRRVRAFRRLLERSDAKEEQRFRAIPALIRREARDEEMARLGLNENLQRDELAPADAAAAIARYRQLMNLKSARDVAQSMGLDENRVKRLLRLNDAPDFIKKAVADGILVEQPGSTPAAPKRKRQTLELMAALEFGRLYRFLDAKDPKRAEARVQAGIDKALRESWGFRRVEAYVNEQLARGDESQGPKTIDEPVVKPVFAMKANVLSVDTSRCNELSDEQRAALAALMKTLYGSAASTH